MKQETVKEAEARPVINVTPLIDILLVLLIIFMAIAPLKPNRFEAKVPSEPDNKPVEANPLTLVVTIGKDLSLKLNGSPDMGTTNDTGKLSEKLVSVFKERKANKVYDSSLSVNLMEDERVLRTVFVKAPRSLNYGEIVKVIDSLKGLVITHIFVFACLYVGLSAVEPQNTGLFISSEPFLGFT